MVTIFSKILHDEVPAHKVAENERFFAFLDINPSSIGHTLVVPRIDTDYLFDLDDDNLTGLILFAGKIAKAMDSALGCMRTGVIVQGLEIPHAHIHLIPIYESTQEFSLGKKVDLSEEVMEQVAAKIRSQLNK